MYTGKDFEADVAASAREQGFWYYKIKDSFVLDQKINRVTTVNPFDALCNTGDVLYALEMKSTKYKSIGFQFLKDDPKAQIPYHQIKALAEFSTYRNQEAGFLFQFRDEEEGTCKVYWLDILGFATFVEGTDKHSINALDIVQHGGKVVEVRKLRSHYRLDLKKLFCIKNV